MKSFKQLLLEAIDVTNNENFMTWFRNSKVVDKLGKPIVAYHGTITSFNKFDPSLSNTKSGTGVPQGTHFFSSDSKVAASYAGQKSSSFSRSDEYTTYAEGSNIIPVYLSICKPLKINARGDNWRSIYYKNDDWSINDLAELAKSKNYDGVIISNLYDVGEGTWTEGNKKSTVYVTFSPTQVKSAIGNNGKFNPNNPDITK